MRESYTKKLAMLRSMHAKQWEEFLQLDAQRRQQQARQQMSGSGFGSYKQPAYSDYDGPVNNPHYVEANVSIDSRGRYTNSMENYSRPHSSYGEFQRSRRDDFGKAYNRC